jgi:hypothetical protein
VESAARAADSTDFPRGGGYRVAEMMITTDRPRPTLIRDQLKDRRGTYRRGPRRLAAIAHVMSVWCCSTRVLAISGCMGRFLRPSSVSMDTMYRECLSCQDISRNLGSSSLGRRGERPGTAIIATGSDIPSLPLVRVIAELHERVAEEEQFHRHRTLRAVVQAPVVAVAVDDRRYLPDEFAHLLGGQEIDPL